MAALMLALIATGCANSARVSDGAVMCDRLMPLARRHAAALADDGGPKSIATGRRFLQGFAAACNAGEEG